MKHFLTLAVVAASLFTYSQTKVSLDGEIKGTVTDQDGSPVSAATVYAVPQDPTFDGIIPRSAKTDENGDFDFRGGLALGGYKLYSRKIKRPIPIHLTYFMRTLRQMRQELISLKTVLQQLLSVGVSRKCSSIRGSREHFAERVCADREHGGEPDGRSPSNTARRPTPRSRTCCRYRCRLRHASALVDTATKCSAIALSSRSASSRDHRRAAVGRSPSSRAVVNVFWTTTKNMSPRDPARAWHSDEIGAR